MQVGGSLTVSTPQKKNYFMSYFVVFDSILLNMIMWTFIQFSIHSHFLVFIFGLMNAHWSFVNIFHMINTTVHDVEKLIFPEITLGLLILCSFKFND